MYLIHEAYSVRKLPSQRLNFVKSVMKQLGNHNPHAFFCHMYLSSKNFFIPKEKLETYMTSSKIQKTVNKNIPIRL